VGLRAKKAGAKAPKDRSHRSEDEI